MRVRNFEGYGLPVLFDEWAHPACYTYATLQEDPNIREFWGISLDKMWSGLFETSGGLGGAIWGYVDETFMVPEMKEGEPYWKTFAKTTKPDGFQGECVGYGEWGIVDVWRREKPEFWSTKKAYSPVRILKTEFPDYEPGTPLVLPVFNRFDHTDLAEIRIEYTFKGETKPLSLELSPHGKGSLLLPGDGWKPGDRILVEFYTFDNKHTASCRGTGKGIGAIIRPVPLPGTGRQSLCITGILSGMENVRTSLGLWIRTITIIGRTPAPTVKSL